MTIRPFPSGGEEEKRPEVLAVLADQGTDAVLLTEVADLDSLASDPVPSLALIEFESVDDPELRECIRRCSEIDLPVIVLVPEADLVYLDVSEDFNDFVVVPAREGELVSRARRALGRATSSARDDVIQVGELVIDPTNYEVTLKNRKVNLRFKEYELLVLMASTPGRVYTREALLNQIWGYEYLGGTRTVDVHIRRLRSKIEDAEHQFIETVWNVGYRLQHPGRSG